ncbi:MAG TPA: 3-hydroxyacyl-CoA dehydrogenase [Alphaproteobacteria bacterium]|nr:3-hydroxyacyl-CoA dehydrogenase [Alphaproteobacteria bacterium]
MSKVGIVGAGLIGRAWAIVFARAGFHVAIWDGDPKALNASLGTIKDRLDDLRNAGLVDDPDAVLRQIEPRSTLQEAIGGAEYVQENLPETVEIKRRIFAEMDGLAPGDAILASSTSSIPASAFTESLQGRARCLVAHPVNPPYLIPVVELCGAPWTVPDTVARTRALMERAGQAPVTVQREIQGFILNRLQGALLNEAFRLVEDGYVTPDDLDKTIAHGLGLRWSFMGPFETIDLNAPGGVRDYCERYGPLYYDIAKQQADPRPWRRVIDRVEADRNKVLPRSSLAERQTWRDRRLMALAAHKRKMEEA